MKSLAQLVLGSEERILVRLAEYARQQGYAKYTSTLAEAWRLSVSMISQSLVSALEDSHDPPELGPDLDYMDDPIAAFGVLEAKRHRARGVTLGMFLGLMKYYRQSYIEVILEGTENPAAQDKYERYLNRFFDRIELGFCEEWISHGENGRVAELQASNRVMTNEKNRYLTLFESINNPVIFLNSGGAIENVNHAWAKIFDPDAVPGQSYYGEKRLELDLPWLPDKLHALYNSGAQELSFEQEIASPLGLGIFDVRLKKMLDVSHKFLGTVVILHDITQAKEAERVLQRSHKELEHLVEQRTRDLLVMNKQLEIEVEERKKSEARIKHLNEVLNAVRNVNQLIVHENSRDGLLRGACTNLFDTRGYYNVWISLINDSGEMEESVGVGENFTGVKRVVGPHPYPRCVEQALAELPIVAVNGSDQLCTLCGFDAHCQGKETLAARLEHNGRVFGTLMVSLSSEYMSDQEEHSLILELAGDMAYALYNMEQRKMRGEAEVALQESEHMYRSLFENATEAIFITQEGIIRFSNPKTWSMTGYTKKELEGAPLADLIHPGERRQTVRFLAKGTHGNFPHQTISFRLLHKSGKTLWGDLSTSSIMWQNHAATLNFLRDISTQKSLETQLMKAQKMEAMGTLAGGISHDFNNILTSIMGFSEIGLLDSEPDSKVYTCLDQIRLASLRASDLVKQILTFSRQGGENLEPINLASIITEALNLVRAALPTTVKIESRTEPNLGCILANKTQMHQVLLNLCTNAGHAMRKDGGGLTITLASVQVDGEKASSHPDLRQGPYVYLGVEDTGPGMEPQVLERIFDPFYTTKKIGEGTGLGLSVVHGIVKTAGGAILVDSSPGNGARFELYFPEVTMREKEDFVNGDAHLLPRGTERVLWVDDEGHIVTVGTEMLSHLGYQVTGITDGKLALSTFESSPDSFDLVITDQIMPGITGDKIAKRLQEISPETPVIICSGYGLDISPAAARDSGVRDLLKKPLQLKVLAETVRKALDES